MNQKPYSSIIKKVSFEYANAKKIARMMLDGLDYDEVMKKCCEGNCVEIESEQRRREVSNAVYKRLCTLDEYLIHEFCSGDIVTSKFILVYAITKADSLFFDFMFEKYRDALLSEDRPYLSVDDFESFYESKKQSDLIIAKWGTFTLERLTRGYRNILVESGLGRRSGRNIAVSKIMINPSVEEHIKLMGDNDYLKAIIGGD